VRVVGTPPNEYPGLTWVGQNVSYVVLKQFKGPHLMKTVDITHPILRDSPDVVGLGHLSKKRFHVGARRIVLAQGGEAGRAFVALGPSLDDTPANRELIRHAGAKP
jgi:hypothetical protein